ncbi:MAG TPA: DUF5667 domain-containing protein [Actinomycetota bacterium]
MPRHEDLDDRLDALLDGHEAVVSHEMAPLLDAAAALRASVAPLRLDPATARRHLREALAGPGASPSRSHARAAAPLGPDPALGPALDTKTSRVSRTRHSRSRPASRRSSRRPLRRLATLALAAALVLVPLVLFAGGALPGNPLYQVKLATEQIHLTTVAWSPPRVADLRTQLAGTRLDELEGLVASGQLDQVPAAIGALDGAVNAAEQSTDDAGVHDPRTRALLDQRLSSLQNQRVAQLSALLKRLPAATPTAARVRIQDAVRRSLDQRR